MARKRPPNMQNVAGKTSLVIDLKGLPLLQTKV